MRDVRCGYALAVLFGAGALLGGWLLVSPWVLGTATGSWSWSVRASVWGGLALVVVSAVAMVIVVAVSIQHALARAARA